MAKKTIQTNALSRSMEIRAESLSEESLEIDLVFSTGAQVVRSPWFDEPYIEELSMAPEHVRLNRLNNSAPLLAVHQSSRLFDQIGVIVPNSAKTDGREGTAKARFSTRDDVKPIVVDVKNGIFTKTSVGYRVHKYRDVTLPTDSMKRLLAIDWEPFEVSIVPIPADDLAVIRSEESNQQHACEIETKEDNMTKPVTPEAAAKPVDVDVSKLQADAKREGVESEKSRVAEIIASVRKANLEQSFAEKLIKENVTIDEARAQIIDQIAEKKKVDVQPQHVALGENINKRSFVDGCVEAILHRKRPDMNPLTEVGNKYRRMGLVDMLRFHADKVGKVNPWEMSVDDLVRSAFHTTSDFPEVLANVSNKSLMQGYQYAGQTFDSFVVRRPIKDFKEIKKVRVGEAPAFLQLNEAGEYKYGTIGETKESYYIVPFGRKVKITRQVIINDDIDAFADLPFKFGIQGSMLESDLVYAQITANADMDDGVALFHADHNNLASVNAAIEVGSIGIGVTAMATQKGLDGVTPLAIRPQILLTPVAKETVAAQYSTLLGNSPMVAAQSSNVNPYLGKLITISEPRLDIVSAASWYLIGSKNQVDIIELGYLEGQENGPVLVQEEISGEGIVFKAYMDRGAKVLDYRGLFKNTGV